MGKNKLLQKSETAVILWRTLDWVKADGFRTLVFFFFSSRGNNGTHLEAADWSTLQKRQHLRPLSKGAVKCKKKKGVLFLTLSAAGGGYITNISSPPLELKQKRPRFKCHRKSSRLYLCANRPLALHYLRINTVTVPAAPTWVQGGGGGCFMCLWPPVGGWNVGTHCKSCCWRWHEQKVRPFQQ